MSDTSASADKPRMASPITTCGVLYNPEVEQSDEFAIIMANDRVFYTGGFDDIASLRKSVAAGDVAGNFVPHQDTYYRVDLFFREIVAIIDLRGAAI